MATLLKHQILSDIWLSSTFFFVFTFYSCAITFVLKPSAVSEFEEDDYHVMRAKLLAAVIFITLLQILQTTVQPFFMFG